MACRGKDGVAMKLSSDTIIDPRKLTENTQCSKGPEVLPGSRHGHLKVTNLRQCSSCV